MHQDEFDIGLVDKAIAKLKKSGLTPQGLKLITEEKGLARRVVSAIGILPDDSIDRLASSNIPDGYLLSVWVSFKSRKGRSYIAVHVNRRREGGPYILLSSEDKDRDDFNEVFGVLLKFFFGMKSDFSQGKEDICQIIKNPIRRRHWWTISQRRVAFWASNFYFKNFSQVTIERVCFDGLPPEMQAAVSATFGSKVSVFW